jgi:hypothetical protein
VNQDYRESKETQARSEKLVDLEPPEKMELKENQDYLAKMVAMDNLASQDSKVNLVHHTSKKILNDSKASQHIDLITKRLWMSTIL